MKYLLPILCLFIFSCDETINIVDPIIEGCNDESACNYDGIATSDDEFCTYAEENFDCDGNCLFDVDCAGKCGGQSMFDVCEDCWSPYCYDFDTQEIIDSESDTDNAAQLECENQGFYWTPSGWTNSMTWNQAWDCAGECDGIAVEDQCGVCDVNPDNDCTVDCNGDLDGNAELDECGTCDNNPANDCIQDCAGIWGGNAIIDDCGVCDGDVCELGCNGQWYIDLDELPIVDCAGVCNGTAVLDCADVCNGNAQEDNCGVCNGSSGTDDNYDCDGNCLVGEDCNGDCGGAAQEDNCGVCTGGNTGMSACVQDCTGEWGGNAIFLFPDQWLSNHCYDIESTTILAFPYEEELTGPIPPEIGNLTNLIELDLSNQAFTGTIPSEIGQLVNLTYLDLWGNDLTGQIPSEIGNLINLNEIGLGENQLSGEIPPEVCDLIENNNLEMEAILQGNNLINTCE